MGKIHDSNVNTLQEVLVKLKGKSPQNVLQSAAKKKE